MTRAEIVAVFEGIADIMQIKGDDPRRYQTYRRIAGILDTLQEDIHVLYEQNELIEIPGIGSSTVEKVGELIDTGQCEYYEELKASIPAGVLDLMSIAGVGPATAARLYQELNIDSLEALQQALDAQKLRGLKRMGKKTEEKIREGLEALLRYRQRKLMGDVLPFAWSSLEALGTIEDVEEISLTGSLRRRTETLTEAQMITVFGGDTCAAKMKDVLGKIEWVESIDDNWTDSGGSVRLEGGVQLQVEITTPENFGAELICRTGSEDHIAGLNRLAEQLGLTKLEPGGSAAWASGKSEEEIYAALGLPFIVPELREGGGEIQAALAGQLPQLVEITDIRGDLHVHSTWSDGVNTIKAMAEAAKEMGHEYIAVCDHSISSKIANGLSVERVLSKMDVVRLINERIQGIEILMGSEVDILNDGSLDYPEEILEKLDVVIASIHSGFGMDEATMTQRIITAIENRFVHMIGHPTGRLLHRREPYQVNIEAVIDAAAGNNTALEINAYPDRLDLKDTHARMAKERGVMVAINTDAHGIDNLGLMVYGIYTARRGWLERKDVLNTLPLAELMGVINAQ
ncbi:DNA polymerase/3'-5' exonuclease PolX [Candidatus Poribacteria bacterium]